MTFDLELGVKVTQNVTRTDGQTDDGQALV